mmetsp:Transcript_13531/g.29271  ORF Transcript_13531/g.29271 Transcript_13531/m.29271 type:complete len:497 (-) Transcript_13531:165-1655(-)
MVGGHHLDLIGQEIRANTHRQGQNPPRPLGPAAGEGDGVELLLGAEHHLIWTENHPGFLGPVIVKLHCAVGWDLELDHLVLHPPGLPGLIRSQLLRGVGGGGGDHNISGRLGGEQLLHGGVQLLLPELLVGLQHVGRPHLGPHPPGLHVAHVHPLGNIQRDGLADLQHIDRHRGHVLAGAVHHPPLSGNSLRLPVVEILPGREEQCLILPQHVLVKNLLILQLLPRLQEELGRPSHQLAEPHLGDPRRADGVEDNAELPVCQNIQAELLDQLLVHVADVGLCVLASHKPLRPRLADFPIHIRESPRRPQVQSRLPVDHELPHMRDHHLEDVRHEGPRLAPEPLLPGQAGHPGAVLVLPGGLETQRCVGEDVDSLNHLLHHLLLRPGHIRGQPGDQPLVPSHPALKISPGPNPDSVVGGDHAQWGGWLVQLFVGVQREGVRMGLRGADLTLPVPDFVLAVPVQHGLAIRPLQHRILHRTVVHRRDHQHLHDAALLPL